MKQNFTLFKDCRWLYTPEDDPCLKFWMENDHLNIYSFTPVLNVLVSHAYTRRSRDPDLMIYFAPAFLRGFFRGKRLSSTWNSSLNLISIGFSQDIADHHNALTATVVLAHPSSRGSVRLTGAHPQDLLDIQKNHFKGDEGKKDVIDLREAIKTAKGIVSNISEMHLDKVIYPAEDVTTDEEIEEHIYKNIFGTSPPSTQLLL